MAAKPDIVDCESSDEESYGDAHSRVNEEFVDESISKKMKDVAVHDDDDDDDGDPRSDVESENGAKKNREEDDEKFDDCHDDIIDEEGQKALEREMTDEQKIENIKKADQLKAEGNEFFKKEDYTKAVESYTAALMLCPIEDYPTERSILYGNRAAAKIQLNSKPAAIEDCTKSLQYNPKYMKALIRRAKLYEETEKLDESLEDYKNIQTLDPYNTEARQALIRLPPAINERNEKLKDEMLGKLKDLGNMILKPFGLSTNNFQMQQDPTSGSYSINFNQNGK